VLSLVFKHRHSTELVLQQLGFGSLQDTIVLVKCLEALFLLLQTQSSAELLKWTETVTEAFFLQLSIFGGEGARNARIQEELSYAE